VLDALGAQQVVAILFTPDDLLSTSSAARPGQAIRRARGGQFARGIPGAKPGPREWQCGYTGSAE
jgi:hypothetical protein